MRSVTRAESGWSSDSRTTGCSEGRRASKPGAKRWHRPTPAMGLAALLVGLAAVALSPAVQAATIYVTTTGDNTNDGKSWATAKKTVTAGLTAAASGDQVWVAAGTYLERITLKNGVALYGGFAGHETDLAQRNWVAHVSSLSGDTSGPVVTASSGATADTRIDGFTILNGGAMSGGGVYCSSSSPTIVNNKITANGGGSGGGIYCYSSSPIISNNIITANYAESGGGIFCSSSSPTISNNIVSGNGATSGGGIYYSGSSPMISNNTIVANNAGYGGGIYGTSGTSPIISNNIVAFNTSGIRRSGGALTLLNNCVFNPEGTDYTDLTAGAGDMSVDPQLAAVGYGQVHLTTGSPCIDAGSDGAIPAGWTDIDGDPRTYGSHVDIGADEFNGVTPTYALTVVRVSPSGNDANDGTSWNSAKKTVQAAINAVTKFGAGEVWVAAGTYNERVSLKPWAYVYGGFMATESNRTERDWMINATILDGGASGSVVSASYGHRASCIDGFMIRNGRADDGAGIRCIGSPLISNNTITGNTAYRYGGGIYCSGSVPMISNNTITGNVAGDSGGGVYCSNSSPPICNNVITGNGCFNSGGGIHCSGSSPPILNNTIAGNGATKGGGVYCYSSSSSPQIVNNIVAFNSSGIHSESAVPTLSNNCVYNPDGVNYTGVTAGTGDISADPQLVAIDYGQVHLTNGSPCIHAGLDSIVQPGWVDIDGQVRLQGTHVDIGADEFNGTVSPYTPVVIRVSPSGNDTNDGSTWTLAKRTIQAGVDSASYAGGGEVWVAAGTYNQRVSLKSWAYIHGGFAGTESSQDQREWLKNMTVLDGGAGGSVVCASSGHRASGIDGCTIRNGSGNSVGSSSGGGGVLCVCSSPIITNNVITGSIGSYGAGIYCYHSSATISNNTITGNTASDGGGIYCYSSSPIIVNNTIVGNIADLAGGISCIDSTSPTMIANNIVAFNSSGIRGSDLLPTLRNNCVFNPDGYDYSGVTPGVGDIAADPRLLAAGYGDIHLMPNSPCINAGLDDVVRPGSMDVDGQPRINGMHVDIGADEFDGVTPPLTTRVVRVSPSGNDGNDGSSWALAKLTVQGGINAAFDLGGADVWVAAGTYKEKISVKPYTYIYGGFAGAESSRDQRNWTANASILDGGGGGSVVVVGGHRVNGIDGFTIRNGGDGINCADSAPTISNNTIIGSKSRGIYCGQNASPLVVHNLIIGNIDDSVGGGIYCHPSSSPLILGNTIKGNAAKDYGGGIRCDSSNVLIANNVITGNSASRGGGVYCFGCAPTIANNTIVENSASSGGGIYCDSAPCSPVISNNIVAFNSSGIGFPSGLVSSPVLRNNCFYNPDGSNYLNISPGTGDFSADPRLLAVSFGEVHLTAESPCIDTGLDAVVQPCWVDADGESRIQGTHVDIGADEFDGITPSYVPAVVRVSLSGNDANDGSEWTLAKQTVQAGIDAVASTGGEVWVAAGTYNQRITLKASAYVYGGFAGTETNREERDRVINLTILDGQAGGSVVRVLSGHRVSGIDGFTIRNGSGSSTGGSSTYGGGVYCVCSSPVISYNIITASTSPNGGGIYCLNSSATIMGNKVLANIGSWGGGIYCAGGSPVISSNAIAGNGGSGILCSSSSAVIVNNTIVANAAGAGAGVYCENASPVVANNIVAFNSSGIYLRSGGTPSLRKNCIYNPDGANYSGLVTGSGDVSVDPQLVAVDFAQFHLVASSPCIEAGDDSMAQPGWRDIDDQPRIQGSHVDIGADEFDGTTPPYASTIVRVSLFGDDAHDGSSWALAKRTVQAGIDTASSLGGEVWVAAGTYNERIVLTPWAHIYGGFVGTESIREERNWTDNVAILDGGAAGSVVRALSSHRVSRLDGLTIRNGKPTSDSGGGVYCANSSPIIANSRITNNASGGVYCSTSSPMISNSTILGNVGGGLSCSSSSPVVTGSVILRNTASIGAGISCSGSSPRISDTLIAGNVASSVGGGMYCDSSSSPQIVNVVFTGNKASNPGGGMCSYSSAAKLTQCTFSGNSSSSGAGFCNLGGNPSLINCILWGNHGPAITKSAGSPTLTYCDVEGGWIGTGNGKTDPKFVRGASPGGDGTWGTADDDYGDFRLQAGSPCIDAGSNAAAVAAGIVTDLDGHERFFDDPATPDCTWAPGTCGTAPIVDMGAYEFIAGDYDRDGDVDKDDLTAFLGCVSGPTIPYAGNCAGADFDRDGDVDQADFGAFQKSFSGTKAGK